MSLENNNNTKCIIKRDQLGKEYIQVGDYKQQLSFSRQTTEWAVNYTPVPEDRFIVTYFKSGTTWTQHIVRLIMTGGGPLPPDDEQQYFKRFFIELIGQQLITNLAEDSCKTVDGIRVIKTHLSRPLLPYSSDARYLLVLRNPKDVCVSFYYHVQQVKSYKPFESFDHFFDTWIAGQLPSGDYFEFIRRYWLAANGSDTNIKIIFYEQMQSHLKDNILTIAEFLSPEYRRRLLADGGRQLDLVVSNCSLGSMKEYHKNDSKVRKGIIGDWRSHLSAKQSHAIDRRVAECWADTDLATVWVNELKWSD